ncbi:hypothetical protein SAMN05216238_102417 [Lentibacillus persicus]|uniref:Uncharacterized protein n=1 Tax=Lentibacillus persicus TaxID=640948 RepID=A0A1I1TS20_9BACI|nr:hypothetical protein [Lentibacillus persicus]SFD61314.1 hypothetical protein SAMN05216238_102417 [Lentibacillus persicus]
MPAMKNYNWGVDRMINEGLGGGFIIDDYDARRLDMGAETNRSENLTKLDKSDYYDIDRMINEGLGGGFIIYDYDVKKLEEHGIGEAEAQLVEA